MIGFRPIAPRAITGLCVGLWILLIASGSLRAHTLGPDWGVWVVRLADGRPVAAQVDSLGAAFNNGIRNGDGVLGVDAGAPDPFVDRQLPASVRSVSIDSARDGERAVDIDDSVSLLAMSAAGALLFVFLGAVVYRWSADRLLAGLFLLFSAAFATALAALPAAQLGHRWANYLTPTAVLIAAPSLFGLFLAFPRPLRYARQAAAFSLLLAVMLALLQVVEAAFAPAWLTPLDDALWLWTMLNLLGAVGLLALRAMRRVDRDPLKPLLIGTALGTLPLIGLYALPSLLGQPALLGPEGASLGLAAIPVGFAYSILRHQVFGLDTLLRRVVLRISGAVPVVLIFVAVWRLLLLVDVPIDAAALFAVALAAVLAPPVFAWTALRVDAWLYRPLFSLRAISTSVDSDSLELLGTRIACRLRQLLPIHWAAATIREDASDELVTRVLGIDGNPPAWLQPPGSPPAATPPDDISVVPIHRFDSGVVSLLAGPRLDGGSLDGIQLEAMRILARAVAASVEAALLRERAGEEASFRQGLTDHARDLAAAATVTDVLRCLSVHAVRLFGAEFGSLWRNAPSGPVAVLDQGTADAGVEALLNQLAEIGHSHGRERDWTAISGDGRALGLALDDGADEPIVCLLRRDDRRQRFGPHEVRRAAELMEHTRGALRRAAERELLEEQLRHRAFYDGLTGLPNRALFLDRIGHGISRSEGSQQELAVLYIDLDRFKGINDSLGHAAGDQLLVQVGKRLRACLRESDTIARLAGDEFTVLLEGPTAVADASRAAERILAALRSPFSLDGIETYAAASIGISGGTAIRATGRDLLREADSALYKAKSSGRGRATLFEPHMSHLPSEHLHLESELHRAIARNELRVHYQPIFRLADGRITGVEALVRWAHPDKGLVPPGNFIPLAEDSGLIVPIGRWVLEESCRQMRAWQDRYASARSMSVSVNLSARQLQDPDLLADIDNALQASGLHPKDLQLEITESVVMQEPEATLLKLDALKRLGIKLAVDDFGTGYSSLAYLKRFPIDVLKIDRAFVTGLGQGERDSAIVQTVVSLAQALGLRTTAEGIEERAEWTRLQQLGCDQGQGFIFSRPLQADALAALLRAEGEAEAAHPLAVAA